MTDTTSQEGSSDGKLCNECGAPFSEADDKRYSWCAACRGAQETPITTTESPSEVEAVVLDVEACRPPPIEERGYYWCGATRDCPMDITLGGFEFPQTIGRIVKKANGEEEMQPGYQNGVIHRLTEANVALIKEHCANRIVRNFRSTAIKMLDGTEESRHHGELRGIHGHRRRLFIPHPNDKSLGQFVYMVKVRHAADRPMTDPPTMVARDW